MRRAILSTEPAPTCIRPRCNPGLPLVEIGYIHRIYNTSLYISTGKYSDVRLYIQYRVTCIYNGRHGGARLSPDMARARGCQERRPPSVRWITSRWIDHCDERGTASVFGEAHG